MMKFFRKHNKKLLAVFMSLLMIVFVGGGALNSLMTPGRNEVVANTVFGPITYLDQRVAQNTTQILERMGQDWRRPLGVANTPLTETDWVLLTKEAQKLGTLLPAAAIETRLADPTVSSRIELVAHNLRIKPARVLGAVAEMQSVQEAALAIAAASIPSEAEIRTAARNALDKVKMNAAALPASAFVDMGQVLPEAELEAHFRAHAEKEPGEGLNFGYYVPPSVRIQYVKIDRDATLEDVSVADLDRKAKAYYQEYRETDIDFRKPPDELADRQSAQEELAGPPAPPEYLVEVVPYLDWEDVKEIAIHRVRMEHANEAAAAVADWILRYAGERWAEAERGESGYKVAPAECAEPAYYESVVEHMPANLAYPKAVSLARTEFFTAEEASELAEIGRAEFRPRQGLAITLRDLAFLTEGLVPQIPTGEDVKSSDYLGTYQTCQYPLTDPDGNVYVFRVVDTREAHTPESLDEVRERVIEDLRLQRGYEAAHVVAKTLLVNANAVGLQNAYDEDSELASLAEVEDDPDDLTQCEIENEPRLGYFSPGPFSRVQRFLAAYGRTDAGVFIPGGIGELEWLPNDVVDMCFALEEPDEKAVLVELKEQATLLVVEWASTIRAREEEFMGLREQLVQQMAQVRSRDTLTEWFDAQKIRTRNGYEPAKR